MTCTLTILKPWLRIELDGGRFALVVWRYWMKDTSQLLRRGEPDAISRLLLTDNMCATNVGAVVLHESGSQAITMPTEDERLSSPQTRTNTFHLTLSLKRRHRRKRRTAFSKKVRVDSIEYAWSMQVFSATFGGSS